MIPSGKAEFSRVNMENSRMLCFLGRVDSPLDLFKVLQGRDTSDAKRIARLPLCYLLLGYAYAKLGWHSRGVEFLSQCLELRVKEPLRNLSVFLKARDCLREIKSFRSDLAYIPTTIRFLTSLTSVALAGYAVYQYQRSELSFLYDRFDAKSLTILLVASLVGLFIGLYFPYIRKLKIPGVLDIEFGKEISTSTMPEITKTVIKLPEVNVWNR